MSRPTDVLEALRSSDLFAVLDLALLEHMTLAFREAELAPGEILMRQGEDADHLAVVLEGRLGVVLEGEREGDREVRLHDLEAGSVVGEVALMVGGQRSATVRALEPTRVFRLSRASFDRLLKEDPARMKLLNRALRERLWRVKLAAHLPKLFGRLEPEALREIEAEVEWLELGSGEVLFRQGDEPTDGVYIVVGGRLRVVVEGDGGERWIDDAGRGEWVGEMALLTQGGRSATVYAVRDSELARLSRDAFERLMTKHPRAMLETSRLLVTRLERQMREPVRRPTAAATFAVVPASPEVQVADFARRLSAALGSFGPALHLNAERVDYHLEDPGIARVADDHATHFRLTQWLIEQENAHRFMVFQTESAWSGWTQRCLRHADHILIVADAAADPAAGGLEQRLESSFSGSRAPRRSLVLLRPQDGTSIAGTVRWLDPRQVDAHYHVRRDSAADFARLARLLTGNAIGLVLGGGGARGYGHYGVLRALKELDVPIDAIGGTSAGALIGAGQAAGQSASRMLELVTRYGKKRRDTTLPLVSLLAGRHLGSLLRECLGARQIEDLPIPFFCISTDLTQAEEIVHRRGSLERAVRASMSLPGILPPVVRGGDLLIDGGLFNNLPIDVMASVCHGGPVLAVDVSPEKDLKAAAELTSELSGWQVLWQRLNPFAEEAAVPGILDVLARTVVVGSVRRQKAQAAAGQAALYLRLPLDTWKLLDLHAAAEIAAAGYQAAREPIRQWWAGAAAELGCEGDRAVRDRPPT